jgi:AraC family transcriptional regulator
MDLVSRLQKAVDYIEDNIIEDPMYDVIARHSYMSVYHFQRLFAVLCNCTVGEYIRNRRLTMAGDELLATDNKIIEIALKYRYETPEGFTRAFTRFHGFSPLEARTGRINLRLFAKISIRTVLKGRGNTMYDLKKRGYTVKENGPVYYTKDVDKTAKWFEDVLGWYAGVDARDDNGIGQYGCAMPVPGELISMQITDFGGIHLFIGESQKHLISLILIKGIYELYAFVKENGWKLITEIEETSYSS